MKKLYIFFTSVFQPALAYVLAALVIAALFWFQLPDLTQGVAGAEIEARNQADSLTDIVENPIFAPHKLMQYLLIQIGPDGALAMRFISTIVALSNIFIFYRVLRLWHKFPEAIIGTLLYSTSSWLLHVGRLATPDVMFTLFVGLLWIGMLLRQDRRSPVVLGVSAGLLAALCYIPGFLWVAAAGSIWQRKAILREMNSAPHWSGIYGGVIFLTLAPLIWAIVQDSNIGMQLAGLPQTTPDISTIGRNFVDLLRALFVSGLDNYVFWLPGTPLLDAFSVAMLVLGGYSLYGHHKLDRVRFMLGFIATAVLLVVAGGMVSPAILLPFCYILVAGGVGFMLNKWYGVFPHNPWARNLGFGLLAAAVSMTIYYQLNHYFVAWPNTPETKAVFDQQF